MAGQVDIDAAAPVRDGDLLDRAARFYAASVLPQVAAWSRAVTEGAATVFAFGAALL